ncbi:MAG: transketolase [Clostridia bacterium]|nr:transketolase [Clostridia bacterium]
MDTLSIARDIRRLTLKCINSIGSGHVGGCLSIVDFLAVLYAKHFNFDSTNPRMQGRDRIVLSKGHAGPALYATLCHFGYFPEQQLLTLNRLGTALPSHTNANLTPGVDMTAGSLGQGISGGVGLALGSKMSNDNARIYIIVGDGECQEGQVWEAALTASNKGLDNLCVFVDNNRMQIDDYTDNVSKVEDLDAKWSAFGFHTIRIDGHNHEQLDNALNMAKTVKGIPTAIIGNTVKGKGVSIFEQMGVSNHSVSVSDEQLEKALAELV